MGDTFLSNLAANANPLTPLLVELVERMGGPDLKVYRLRDAWLAFGPLPLGGYDLGEKNPMSATEVCIFVNLGGDLRGGANGALWARIRMHPAFIGDADCIVPEHAIIRFSIMDAAVDTCAFHLLKAVPALGVTAEQKQKDSIGVALGTPAPTYPARIPEDIVKTALARFAALIEVSPNNKGK